MALELQRILNNPSAQPFNSLTNLVDLASASVNMYIVAPVDIKGEVYLFDTRGEEEANLESDITDNWIEENSTMQDHIGLKPIVITLRGYVGELTNKPNPDLAKLEEQYKNTSDKLPNLTLAPLNPFLPTLTTQAQYIVNRAEEAYGIYKKANQTVERLDEKMASIPVVNSTHQQEVFEKFRVMWQKRSLSTVFTPFGFYPDMAILSLNARQSEDTRYITEFTVTLKQIRIADEISTYTDEEKEKAYLANMTMSKQKDKGIKKPTDDRSFLQSFRKEGVQGAKNWAKRMLSD